MSEDKKNLPEIVVEPTTDIVGKDQDKLQKFIEDGLPGIGEVDEAQVAKMFDFYCAGKTYSQISGIMRVQKPVLLYLSHKLNWYLTRQEYLNDLEANIRRRVVEAKLQSQDFLLQMMQMWHKKIGAKMNRYMSTDNEEFSNQINLKELDRYLKTLELLQKSVGMTTGEGKGPLVGINVGEGATVTRTGDNTIEVTPKQKAVGDVLKEYANMRRVEEKK